MVEDKADQAGGHHDHIHAHGDHPRNGKSFIFGKVNESGGNFLKRMDGKQVLVLVFRFGLLIAGEVNIRQGIKGARGTYQLLWVVLLYGPDQGLQVLKQILVELVDFFR